MIQNKGGFSNKLVVFLVVVSLFIATMSAMGAIAAVNTTLTNTTNNATANQSVFTFAQNSTAVSNATGQNTSLTTTQPIVSSTNNASSTNTTQRSLTNQSSLVNISAQTGSLYRSLDYTLDPQIHVNLGKVTTQDVRAGENATWAIEVTIQNTAVQTIPVYLTLTELVQALNNTDVQSILLASVQQTLYTQRVFTDATTNTSATVWQEIASQLIAQDVLANQTTTYLVELVTPAPRPVWVESAYEDDVAQYWSGILTLSTQITMPFESIRVPVDVPLVLQSEQPTITLGNGTQTTSTQIRYDQATLELTIAPYVKGDAITISFNISKNSTKYKAIHEEINTPQVNETPAVFFVGTIPDIQINDTQRYVLDLSQYISPNISTQYTILYPLLDNVSIELNDSLLYFIPQIGYTGTQTFQFFADDGQAIHESNLFNITVTLASQTALVQTPTQEPEIVYEYGTVVVGQPVVWKQRISAKALERLRQQNLEQNTTKSLEIYLPQNATSISAVIVSKQDQTNKRVLTQGVALKKLSERQRTTLASNSFVDKLAANSPFNLSTPGFAANRTTGGAVGTRNGADAAAQQATDVDPTADLTDDDVIDPREIIAQLQKEKLAQKVRDAQKKATARTHASAIIDSRVLAVTPDELAQVPQEQIDAGNTTIIQLSPQVLDLLVPATYAQLQESAQAVSEQITVQTTEQTTEQTINQPSAQSAEQAAQIDVSASTITTSESAPSTTQTVLDQLLAQADDIEIEYTLPGPQLSEEKKSRSRTRVTISSPEHYVNVTAQATLPFETNDATSVKLIWRQNETNPNGSAAVPLDFTLLDLNNNTQYDTVEWIVPHLSTQIFEVILITHAEELDANRNPVRDVFGFVGTKDENATTITSGHYVRVTFEQFLDLTKDITIYATPTYHGTIGRIIVYAYNDTTPLATFENISEVGTNETYAKYQIFLENLGNLAFNTFDLYIDGPDVDIDYIVDPHPVITNPGMLVYGIGTSQNPAYRLWDGSAFGTNLSTTPIGGTIEWLRVAANPVRYEYVVGVADTGDDVNFMVYFYNTDGEFCWGNGTVCGVANEVTTASTTANYKKMGLKYERASGRAMAVWVPTTTSATPLYSLWNGSVWTAPANVNETLLSGNIEQIHVAQHPNPNSNELAVLMTDSNDDANVIIWNGSTWYCQPTALLTTSLATSAYQTADFDYEQLSGDLLVVMTQSGTTEFRYTTKLNGTCAFTSTTTSGYAEQAEAIQISSQPGTNWLIGGQHDTGNNDMEEFVWNGSQFMAVGPNEASVFAETVPNMIQSSTFLGNSNIGVHVYSDTATDTGISYMWYNKTSNTWTCGTTGCNAAGITAFTSNMQNVFTFNVPNRNESLLIVRDDSDDLWARMILLTASGAPTFADVNGGSALESSLSSPAFPSFWFTWQEANDTIRPNISYILPTPANGTNLSMSYIFINTTVNETNQGNLTFNLYNYSSFANSITAYGGAPYQLARQYIINNTAYSVQNFFNFTSVTDGLYLFNVTIFDLADNSNFTQSRVVRVDSNAPSITYAAPTPAANTYQTQNYTSINLSIDEHQPINVTFSLNGTRTALYNDSIILQYDFDNRGNMNESITNILDSSLLGTNNGTGVNTPTWNAAGRYGGAIEFDGATEHVYANNQYTNPQTFSLELWFRSTDNTGGKLIGFGNTRTGASANYDRHIYMLNNGTLAFGIYNGATQVVYSRNNLNDGNWHHVVATLTNAGGTMSIYVDGVLHNSLAGATAENFAGFWRLGYDNINSWPNVPTNYYFAGLIDAVRIFNVALNASEVAFRYNSSIYRTSLNHWEANITLANLGQGTYNYIACANDTVYQSGCSALRNITIDWTIPNISYVAFTDVDGSNTSRSWLSFNVSANDSFLRDINLSIYNSAFTLVWRQNYSFGSGYSGNLSVNRTTLVDGLYWYNASATDWSGLIGNTSTRNITIDTINPNITYVGYTDIQAGNFSRNWFAINVSVNDTNLHIINISVYNSALSRIYIQNYSVPYGTTMENLSLNMTNMVDGRYWFNATAIDRAGNWNGTTLYNITLDTINPNISYVRFTELNGSNLSRNWFAINVSVNDTNLRWINITVYDAALTLIYTQNYSAPFGTITNNLSLNMTSMTNGLYWFNASATDWAGNVNRTSLYNVTIDNINPNISFVSYTELNGDNRTAKTWLAFNVSVNDTNLKWINLSVYNSALTLIWQQNYSVPFGVSTENLSLNLTNLVDGLYYFNASVTDRADNSNRTATYNITLDNINPNISYVSFTEVNGSNLSRSWFGVNVSVNDTNLREINISIFNSAMTLIWMQNYTFNYGVTTNNLSYNTTSLNLVDGIYWFNATALDRAGNRNGTSLYNVTLDTLQPNISYVPTTDTINVTRNYIQMNVSFNDTNIRHANLSFYSSTGTLIWMENYTGVFGTATNNLSLNRTNLADGNYTFNASVTDWTGKITNATQYRITVDTFNPNISYVPFTEIQNNNLSRIWIGVNVSVNDTNLRSINISIYSSTNTLVWVANYTPVVAYGNFSLNFTTVFDDTYYFNASATDWAGRTNSTATQNVTIDTIRPNITYVGYTDINGGNFSRNWFAINVSANDSNLYEINITVFNSAFALIWQQNYSVPFGVPSENLSLNMTNMIDGRYWFNASVTDRGGIKNQTALYNVTLDTINPNISFVGYTEQQNGNYSKNWLAVNVSVNDTNLKWINLSVYDSALALVYQQNYSVRWGTTIENLSLNLTGLASGFYWFNASATDWAGNFNYTQTYNVTLDIINPNISYVSFTDSNYGNYSRNWFAVNVSVNDTNLRWINISAYNSVLALIWQQNYSVPFGVTSENLSLNLTGLVDGLYWFNASVTDWAGNINRTATYNVTLDNTNPNISYVSYTEQNGDNVSRSYIAINITANDSNLRTLNISIYNSALALVWVHNYTVPINLVATNLSLNRTNLVDGLYWFNATATDAYGNQNFTPTYNITLDTINPNISYVGFTDVNYANLSRDWFAINVSVNDTKIRWINISVYNAALTLLWQQNYSVPFGVTIENLSLNMTNMANGTYWFNASATDWAGNFNYTQTYNITLDTLNPNISYVSYTEQNGDNVSRSYISFNVSVNDTQLRWINLSIYNAALTLVWMQNYSVVVGTQIENFSLNRSGLANGLYWFNASVTDWAGNFNYTSTYNITLDTINPNISFVSYTDANASVFSKDWVAINVSVNDTNLKWINISIYNNAFALLYIQNYSVTFGTTSENLSLNLTGLSDGVYWFNASVTDWSGNLNRTQTYQVTIDSAEPNISFVPYTELNNGNYSKNWLAVNVSANDSILRWINISVYNSALALVYVQNYSAPFGETTNNLSLNLTSLADGLYWFNATVTDWARNVNWTPTYNVTLDTTNPNISYVQYTENNGANVSRNWFAINVSVNDSNARWINITVFDSAFTLLWMQNYSVPFGTTIENLSLNMTNMVDGRYWFNASVTDWAGNINRTQLYNITLDTINPNISYVPFTEINNDNLTRIWIGINASVNDSNLRWINVSIYSSANVLLWIHNYSVPFGVTIENLSLNYTTLNDDTFYFNATATDWVGRTNSTPTYNVTLDTVYPNISYIPFTDIHNDNVSRNWIGVNVTANDTTLRLLNISVFSTQSPSSLIWIQNYSTFGTTENLSLNLTGLADGVYWYNASATDFSGRTNYTSTRNITLDTHNPNISYVPTTDFTNVTRSWVQINVTANDTNIRWINISFFNSSHDRIWIANHTVPVNTIYSNLSLNMTNLVDGVYYFNATVLDWSGRTNSTTTYNVSVDTINPNVSYVEYTDINGGNFSRNWFAINISANDTNLKEMNITVYNNAFTMIWMQNYTVPVGVTSENLSLNMTNMVDGIYWFNATVVDWTGHTNSTTTYNVTLDTINPNISYVSTTLANGSNLSQNWIAINVTANDTNLRWMNVSLYNEALVLVYQQNYTVPYGVTSENLSLNVTGLLDGIYWFNASVTDRAGNTNRTVTYNLTLDTTNPNISYVSFTESNSANLSRDWFAINVSANDTNLKWINITVFDAAFALLWQENYSLPMGISIENLSLNMTNMPNGRYWFNASATDWAGNVNRTQLYNVTLDTINPNISYVSYTEQNNNNVSRSFIAFNVSVNDTNLKWINLSLYNSALALVYQQNYSVKWGTTIENLSINRTNLVDGVYWFNASVTDDAGNFNYTPTYNITLDTINPNISYVAYTDINGGNFSRDWFAINVSANDTNLRWVNITVYDEAFALLWMQNFSIPYGTVIENLSLNMTNMPNGRYWFNASATDWAGNVNRTQLYNVTLDTINPNISYVTYTEQFNGNYSKIWIGVNVTANDTNLRSLNISIYDSALTLVYQQNYSVKWGTTIENLSLNFTTLVDGVYWFNATATDWAGNFNYTETRNVTIDTINPNISYVEYTDINGGNFSRDWFAINVSANDTNLRWINITVYDAAFTLLYVQNFSIPFGTVIENLSLNMTNMPNGRYWFNASATDWAGNINRTQLYNITLDTINPNISYVSYTEQNGDNVSRSFIAFNVSVNDTNLKWINLSIYNQMLLLVYQQNYSVRWGTTIENLSINRTNLADGNYWFNASVTDWAGNFNYTPTYNITLDTTAPQIAYVAPTEPNGLAVNRTWIFVNVSITEINLRNTTIWLYDSLGNIINSSANFTNGITYHEFNFTDLADGFYAFNVTAIDTAGNTNNTQTRSVLIDTVVPDIYFTSPTLANNTFTNITSYPLNISVSNSTYISSFTYNWNGTNYSYYNDSLVLALSFSNSPSIGDTSTRVMDVSKYQNNATCLYVCNYTTGRYGLGIGLNNSNNTLRVTDSPTLDNTNRMSWEFWFNAATLDGSPRAILSKRVGTGNQAAYSFFTFAGNRLAVDIDGNDNRFSTNTVFQPNRWYHILVTYDGTQVAAQRVRVYVNGTLDIVATETAASIPNYASDITIGALNFNYGTYFNGAVDEIKIYNTTLSANEASQMYLSNFHKFNSTQWYLYVNQSLNATMGLFDGNYTYYAYVNDTAANANATEIRLLKVDATKPQIAYVPLTEINNSNISRRYIQINVSVNESNYANTTINLYNAVGALINSSFNDTVLNNSANFTVDTDGIYYFNATVYDQAQNVNHTVTRQVTVDTINPNISYVSYTETNNGNYTKNWLAINVSVNDTNMRWINISVFDDDATTLVWMQNYSVPSGVTIENLSLNLTALTDGVYWFYANATDWAGNTNQTQTYNVTLDTTIPNISYVSFTDINGANVSRNWFAINVTVNDTNLRWINISVYDAALALIYVQNYSVPFGVVSENLSLNMTGMIDGIYWFDANVTDWAGNTNQTATRNVTLDTINPNITFVDPTEAAPYTFVQTDYLQTATNVTDINYANTSVYLYTLAGTLINITNSSNNPFYLNYSNVAQGIYLFNASALDHARNYNVTDTRMVGVDLVDPVVAYVLDTPAHMSFVTRNWTIVNITTVDTFNTSTYLDFNRDLLLFYSFSNWSGSTVEDDSSYRRNGTLNNSVVISNLYPIRGDNANFTGGNNDAINLSSSFLTGLSEVTLSFYVRASSTGHDRGIFTAQPADGIERFGIRYDALGANGGANNVITYALTTTTAVWSAETIANQQKAGDWQHIALTWRSGGSPKLYIDGVFTATSWNTSDTLSGTLLANETLLIGDGSQDTNWEGRIDEFMIFNRTLDASEIAALMNSNASVGATSYLANLTNLIDANYTYNGCAQDISGRFSCLANRNVVIDTIRPNISFIAPTEVPDANLSRTWVVINTTANDTNLANITIRLYTNAGVLINTSNVSAFNAQALINGMNFSQLADGVYVYNATATDLAGWTNDTPTYNFTIDTVAPAIDFIAPTRPHGDNWSHNYTQINISAIDVNLHNITIWLYNSSGDLINASSAYGVAASPFFFNFTDLVDGIYYYNATAYDTAGNYNFTETRNITLDTIRPNISYVDYTDVDGANLSLRFIGINVTANDTNFQYMNISIYNSSMDLIWVENTTTPQNVTINFTAPYDGDFYFNATARDWAGWTNSTATRRVLIDTVPPELWYIPPTPDNNSYLNYNWLTINVSINETNLSNVTIWLLDSLAGGSPNAIINQSANFTNGITYHEYNFSDLVDGLYWFNASARDISGNTNFTVVYNVTIDTIRPNISFVDVTDQNATNLSRTWIDINVSVTDVNIRYSNITIYNSSLELIWVQNSTIANNTLNFTTPYDGIFYFNATTLDWAGWTNYTPTWQVNVTGRAVQLELTNITFSNYSALEGQNITAYINVSNLGINNATNVTVQFNLSLWNGTRNNLITLNYTELNVTANSSIVLEYNWTVQVGTFEFSAMVDPENKFIETNETDNTFARNYTTSVWTIYYGLFDYDLFLGNSQNNALYNWSAYGVMFTSYYADVDSTYNPADLVAFNQTDDFNQTDSIFNMSGYNDSVRALFDANDDGVADQTMTAILGGATVTNIPIINSTNTSDFITGILWDSADAPANYNGSQDIVFITFTNYSKVGQYGTYDYEIRIPSALRKLVPATDFVERVVEIS